MFHKLLSSRNRSLYFAILIFSVSLFITSSTFAAPIKVAFIGDQGVQGNAQAVLSLVSGEDTNLLLIQGDLGYEDNTASIWEENINNILGANFPVLTAIGNHEDFEWPNYQQYIQRRIDRISGLSCSGNSGVKAKCSYGNIDIVQVAPGINEVAGVSGDDGYADFIRSSLANSDNHWSICSWHKPHHMMQTGTKNGPTDWSVYDACIDAGAMIALAHEHAYSRTYLLSDFKTQEVVHRGDELLLQPGQSFAFVSGLGGRRARGQARGGDYFASIYTSDQGATSGALFCTFEEKTADCYFKDINGSVPDQFSLVREGSESQVLSYDSAPNLSPGNGYVFFRSDKPEIRWIDQNANGQMGSVWIDSACAETLGGAAASGDWKELMSLAPGFDTIAYPCTISSLQTTSIALPFEVFAGNGFTFSRTDKNEFRWIAENASGDLGSVWIDRACMESLGGVENTGNWNELMTLAPGFDSIDYPC